MTDLKHKLTTMQCACNFIRGGQPPHQLEKYMEAVKTHFMRKNGRQQHRIALVINRGRKWTHVVFVEYPVQVEKIINNEAESFIPLPKDNKKLFRQMQRMAKTWYGRKSNAPKNIQLSLWSA